MADTLSQDKINADFKFPDNGAIKSDLGGTDEATDVYTPDAMENITKMAFNMVSQAEKAGRPVTGLFNDVKIVARPGDRWEDVADQWHERHGKLNYEPKAGDDFNKIIHGMKALADQRGQKVYHEHEGKKIVAEPGDDLDRIVKRMWKQKKK